jgi:hypothetical protein
MCDFLSHTNRIRRVFVLISALADDYKKFAPEDRAVISMLHTHNIPYQLVLTKVDGIVGQTKSLRDPAKADANRSLFQKLLHRCAEIRQDVKDHLTAEATGGRRSAAKKLSVQPPVNDILCVSPEVQVPDFGKLGISNMRWAIMQATMMNKPASNSYFSSMLSSSQTDADADADRDSTSTVDQQPKKRPHRNATTSTIF